MSLGPIRVVVFWDEIKYVAQGLELDVGSQGDSVEEALGRLQTAMYAEQASADELGVELSSIGSSPSHFKDLYWSSEIAARAVLRRDSEGTWTAERLRGEEDVRDPMTCMLMMVERFSREVVGLPVPESPTRLGDERKRWALSALREELAEFADATAPEDEVDALIDLTYFALGRLVEMGVAPLAAFQEVHAANMRKARGEQAKRPGSLGHDAVKPEGWEPPDLGPLLTVNRDEIEWLVAMRALVHSIPKGAQIEYHIKKIGTGVSYVPKTWRPDVAVTPAAVARHEVDATAPPAETEGATPETVTSDCLASEDLPIEGDTVKMVGPERGMLETALQRFSAKSMEDILENLKESFQQASDYMAARQTRNMLDEAALLNWIPTEPLMGNELKTLSQQFDLEEDRPKILILGYGRHGKDTAAEYLRDAYGLRFTSSSLFCAEHVVLPYMRTLQFGYASPQDCFEDRHNNRGLWYEAISKFNREDPTRLARAIFEDHDVYCGLRSRRELNAVKNAGLADHVLWVDRMDREPEEDRSSCDVEPWMADFVVDNNGTPEDMKGNLDVLMERLGLRAMEL